MRKTKKFEILLLEEDKRIFNTVKVIVTDCHDKHSIWEKWHNYVTFESSQRSMSGTMIQYSQFGKNKPCWACLWIENIDSYKTVFVDPCGAYQDYKKLDEVTKELFPNAIETIDSNNFHNHPAWQNLNKQLRKDGMWRHAVALETEAKRLRHSIFEM